MPLIKFSGNYPYVMDSLNLPAGFYAPQATLAKYVDQIEKDLPRTAYMSYSLTSEQLKERLRRTDDIAIYSYTQGNFVGSIFTNISFQSFTKRNEWLIDSNGDKALEDSISLCYTDDNNNVNAFCLNYLRDDSDLSIPEPARPRYFAAVVISNANLAPLDRTVTYFSYDQYLSPEAKNGEAISSDEFIEQLNTALNSNHLTLLLANLFDGEQLAIAPFNALAKRIVPNSNIDNRDEKQEHLQRFYQFATDHLANNSSLKHYLEEIKERAATETNFFNDEPFNQVLTQIYQQINTAIGSVESSRQSDLKTLNKLNLWIIKLYLTASSLTDESDAFQHKALQDKAKALSEAIDATIPNFSHYKQLNYSQVEQQVAAAATRMQELKVQYKKDEMQFSGKEFHKFIDKLYTKTHNAIDFSNAADFEGAMHHFSDEVQKKIDSLHQQLIQQVTAHAEQLQAIGQNDAPYVNDLPEFIRQALLIKAEAMLLQITTETPQQLAKAYIDQSVNQLINHVFSTIEQQEKQKIADETEARVQALPIAAQPKADERSFFIRNGLSLGFATGAALVSIGLILIATGVLAPIGIAFTGLALIATLVGASSAAALVVGAALKIASDETERQEQFVLANQLHNEYTQQLSALSTAKESQYQALTVQLQQHKQSLESVISQSAPQDSEQLIESNIKAHDEVLPSLLDQIGRHLDNGEQHVIDGGEIKVDMPKEPKIIHRPIAGDEVESLSEETDNHPGGIQP